jgi:hypothetical protein
MDVNYKKANKENEAHGKRLVKIQVIALQKQHAITESGTHEKIPHLKFSS